MQKQRKRVLVLSFAALLAALSVVIAWLCKTYMTIGPIRVTFENFPIILASLVLGPITGGCVGLIADIISSVLSAYSPNPLILLGSVTVGVVPGLFWRKKTANIGTGRLLLCVYGAHMIGCVLIKSAGLLTLGYPFPVVAWRLPLYIGIAAAETVFLSLLLRNRGIQKTLGRLAVQ